MRVVQHKWVGAVKCWQQITTCTHIFRIRAYKAIVGPTLFLLYQHISWTYLQLTKYNHLREEGGEKTTKCCTFYVNKAVLNYAPFKSPPSPPPHLFSTLYARYITTPRITFYCIDFKVVQTHHWIWLLNWLQKTGQGFY